MIASTPRRHRSPLHDGSLFQPRRPAFWVYVAIVVATGIVSVGQQSLFRQISPSGWALSWALLALYALPVLFLVYVLDLYEREPLSLVLGALLWGAVAATTLSGFANDGWGLVVARVGGPEFAARWTAALTAPFVEETLKGLGVVMIYLIAPDEFDDMMDGFVYGAVCGLGFAVVEDVFYFMGVFGGHPNGVLQGFFVRVVASGLYSHVLVHGARGHGDRVPRVAAAAPAARQEGHRPVRALRGGRARALPVELPAARPVPIPAVERGGPAHDPRGDRGEGTPAPRASRRSPSFWRAGANGSGCGGRSPTRSAGPGSRPTSSRCSRRRGGGGRRWPRCGRARGAAPPGCSAGSSASR